MPVGYFYVSVKRVRFLLPTAGDPGLEMLKNEIAVTR